MKDFILVIVLTIIMFGIVLAVSGRLNITHVDGTGIYVTTVDVGRGK